jgi:hypothetical protein
MASASEASNKIAEFLADRVSLEQLDDWSASFSWDIHKTGEEQAQAIAYQVRAILNEYSDDASEDRIRKELVQLRARIETPNFPLAENRCGGPSSAPESNTKFAINVAAA